MKSEKINKMLQSVEDSMVAASFAEQGDSVSARSVLHEGRRVLLGLRKGHIDAKTLKYALNSVSRIHGRLDILYVGEQGEEAGAVDPAVTRYLAELTASGVAHRLIRRTGCLKQEIIDYTNSEKEIIFAVIESPRSLDAACVKRDRSLAELWQKLNCPLVVVMDGAKA